MGGGGGEGVKEGELVEQVTLGQLEMPTVEILLVKVKKNCLIQNAFTWQVNYSCNYYLLLLPFPSYDLKSAAMMNVMPA